MPIIDDVDEGIELTLMREHELVNNSKFEVTTFKDGIEPIHSESIGQERP